MTAKATVAYAPKQNALSIGSGKEDNLYLAGDLSAGVPNDDQDFIRQMRGETRGAPPPHPSR